MPVEETSRKNYLSGSMTQGKNIFATVALNPSNNSTSDGSTTAHHASRNLALYTAEDILGLVACETGHDSSADIAGVDGSCRDEGEKSLFRAKNLLFQAVFHHSIKSSNDETNMTEFRMLAAPGYQ